VQLREEFNIDIRVLGIADSKHMLTSEGGIDLTNWREQWETNKQPSDLQVRLQETACAIAANASL
jgi:hypothetical protein